MSTPQCARFETTWQPVRKPAFGSYPSHVFRESKCFAGEVPESALVLLAYSQQPGASVILEQLRVANVAPQGINRFVA